MCGALGAVEGVILRDQIQPVTKRWMAGWFKYSVDRNVSEPLKVASSSVLLQEFDLLWGNCRLNNRYSVCIGPGSSYTPIIVKRFNLVPLYRRRLVHNAHIGDSKALTTGNVEPADPYARDRAFAREFFKGRMIFGGRPRQMHPPPRAPAPSLLTRGRLPGGPKNASLWPRGPVPGSNGFESRRNLPRPESRIDEGWNVVSGRSSGALVLAV
ncbi:hypothetical protein FRC07_011192 [Ceratobasidium sp. 392]|nr:hypothetical protein FRC07_011192 [Ceratobasidium sp. 392]